MGARVNIFPLNTSHKTRDLAMCLPMEEAATETTVTRMRYVQPILYSMNPSISQHAWSVAPGVSCGLPRSSAPVIVLLLLVGYYKYLAFLFYSAMGDR